MKSFVGYVVTSVETERVLVEPILLCKTPERIRIRLDAYLEHTSVPPWEQGSLETVICPASMALSCLTKADNVLADPFCQAALDQCLAKLASVLGAPRGFQFKVARSKMAGISLLNIPRYDRNRLSMILGVLNLANPEGLREF